MMSYFRFFFLLTCVLTLISQFPIEVSAQTVDPKSGFSQALAECGTQFDFKISRSISDRAEEAIKGNSRLDIQSFLNIFPESDRIKAYSIFQECLSRRYQSDKSDGSINISKLVSMESSSFPDITNKLYAISGSVATIGNRERRFGFSVSKVCEISLVNATVTGSGSELYIEDDKGNEVFRFERFADNKTKIDAGNFFVVLKVCNHCGNIRVFLEGSIEARCK